MEVGTRGTPLPPVLFWNRRVRIAVPKYSPAPRDELWI